MDKKTQLEKVIEGLESFKQERISKIPIEYTDQISAFSAKIEQEKAKVQTKIDELTNL